MPFQESNLMKPDIEDLLEKVDTKFTLVSLAAKRAREINDYYNQLGEGLGRIVPPQITSTARKSLSIALEEVAANKIVARKLDDRIEENDEIVEKVEKVDSSEESAGEK